MGPFFRRIQAMVWPRKGKSNNAKRCKRRGPPSSPAPTRRCREGRAGGEAGRLGGDQAPGRRWKEEAEAEVNAEWVEGG